MFYKFLGEVRENVVFIWLFTRPEASFLASSSIPKTRVCGTKAQPALMLQFSFYLLMNSEFAWFTLASNLTPGLGFQLRYGCKHFHARKLNTNFELACNHSQQAISSIVNLKNDIL
jgi:hypothetical protein